jgi:pimeloyl-ACP methyl ester carboxylesterase
MNAPLLLIHGFPLDRRTWSAQIDALSASRRVVAPDLPGFGAAPPDPSIRTMDDYARGLLALLDRLAIPRCSAAGHSMGGYVLFALLRLAPERLAGVGLVSTRAAADSDEARRGREATAQRAEREGPGFLAESMPSKLFGSLPSAEAAASLQAIMRSSSPAGTAAAARAMASRPDARPQLAGIRVPTVLIAGRNDAVVPPAESEAMAAAIPGSRLVWAERSGHLPMLEEPGLVTSTLAVLP